MMLHTEFRSGNISANFDLLSNIKEALAALPPDVVGAQYRADGAGYNHELLKYLDAEKGAAWKQGEVRLVCIFRKLKQKCRAIT